MNLDLPAKAGEQIGNERIVLKKNWTR